MREIAILLSPDECALLMSAQAARDAADRSLRVGATHVLRTHGIRHGELARLEAHDDGVQLIVRIAD